MPWLLRPSGASHNYKLTTLRTYNILLCPRNKKSKQRDTLPVQVKKEMSKMHIREATLADIPRLAEIWSIAFFDDAFYNTIFPRRREFLDDYRNMWTKKLQKRFLQLGEQYLVAETDVVDTNGRSRTEVTGWASWTRMGSSKAAEKIAADGESILRGEYRTSWAPCRTGLG